MEIRPLDPGHDAQMRRFHEIGWRAEKEDGRPWNPMWSFEEMAGFFRMPSDDRRTVGVTAWDGDEMVGAGWAMLPLLDNTDKAECFVVVEPELRGRGIGATVLDGLVEVVRADGRTTLMSNAGIPFEERADHPIMRWAARNGFEVANVEIMRTLYLPVAADLLDAVEAESAPHHDAYDIATYVDELPDELLPSYCRLNNQLVLDAPMGDLDYEEEALTPEVHKQRTARNRAVGRTVFTTLALLGGEVVAHTDLAVPGGVAEAYQWGTLVHRDHRGHRLGAAVKAANLRRMQQARPGVPRIVTTNAEVNRYMVAINERLGFVAEAVVPSFKRVL